MHPPEVVEMPTSLRFWRWEKFSKVVKPMNACDESPATFLLHLYWPLRDWDKPYWGTGTGQPSSMRPRFVQRTDLIKALREHCTFFRVLWLNIRAPLCGHLIRLIRMLRFYGTAFFVPGQSRSILTPIIRTPVNADNGYFFLLQQP